MTDPTTALAETLADALNMQGRMPCYDPACSDRHLGYCPTEIAEIAAAILASLPPDWCGHGDDLLMAKAQEAAYEAEIARLRAIEAAARADARAVPNEPGCTCGRDDDSAVGGGPLIMCEMHERMLRPLRWETLAMMVLDLLAREALLRAALEAE